MKNLAPRLIALGVIALFIFLWGRVAFDTISNPGAMLSVIVDYVVIPSLVLACVIFVSYGVYRASRNKRGN